MFKISSRTHGTDRKPVTQQLLVSDDADLAWAVATEFSLNNPTQDVFVKDLRDPAAEYDAARAAWDEAVDYAHDEDDRG